MSAFTEDHCMTDADPAYDLCAHFTRAVQAPSDTATYTVNYGEISESERTANTGKMRNLFAAPDMDKLFAILRAFVAKRPDSDTYVMGGTLATAFVQAVSEAVLAGKVAFDLGKHLDPFGALIASAINGGPVSTTTSWLSLFKTHRR